LEEIRKCREEAGGPFFNTRENKRLREQQEQLRKEEELRRANMIKPSNIKSTMKDQICVSKLDRMDHQF